jgi:hypothetical protein
MQPQFFKPAVIFIGTSVMLLLFSIQASLADKVMPTSQLTRASSKFVVPSKEYDYSWLLKFAGEDTAWLILTEGKHFESLLNQVVPIQKGYLSGRHLSLKDYMEEVLGGPPNNVTVDQQRYVGMSASRAHSATEKGFIGIDVKDGKSICGVVHYFFKNSDDYTEKPQLYLASKNYASYSEVPEPIKFAIKKWLENEEVQPIKVRFSYKTSIVNLPGIVF